MCVVVTFFFYVFILLVRMNFSHGSHEYHQSVIDNTRAMVKSKLILHLLQLPVSERSSIRGSQWTSCCHRFGHSQSYLSLLRSISISIPQKGPEIRTGVTRENKDVRHYNHSKKKKKLIISSSGPFLVNTSSSSRPTPNTAKFAMTRSCGLTM